MNVNFGSLLVIRIDRNILGGNSRWTVLTACAILSGCFGNFTDAATRLAADVQDGADRVGESEGAFTVVEHATPSRDGECEGPYKVQADKVGAIVIWCYDAAGNTVSSHSTTSHSTRVDSRATFIVDKGAGEPLHVRLERIAGRIVITDVN